MPNPLMTAWLQAATQATSTGRVNLTSEIGRQQADLVKVWMDAWMAAMFPWLPRDMSGAKRKA